MAIAPYHCRYAALLQRSYEVIKRRERKRAEGRGARNTKQKSDAQTRHSCNCRHAILECAQSDFTWQGRASMSLIPTQHTERVLENARAAQTDTELQGVLASPTPTFSSLLEGQAIIDLGNKANAEHQQGSTCHGERYFSLDDAYRISVRHDDLGAMSMELERTTPHHEKHTMATPPQPETSIATRQDRMAIDYQPIPEVTTEEHITPDGSKAAAGPSRAGGGFQSDVPGFSSSKRDEVLRHLRDASRPSNVPHFLEMLPEALQHRHQQLSLLRRNQKSTATAIRQAPLHKPIMNMARQSTAQRREAVVKPSKNVEVVTCPDIQDYDVPRTSRRGRPIKHPFRHRPSEGYLL